MRNTIDAFRNAEKSRVRFVDAGREYGNRRVFGSHDNTAHVWASNKITSGRASDERMFFESGVIFSYGRHFALGVILTTSEGRVTLLNSDGYSPSTGKHKSHVSHAAHGQTYHAPALTDIAVTLSQINAGHESAWSVRGWIKKHILTAPAETVIFVARCIGESRKLCAYWRAADLAERKARAAHEARDKANRIMRAKNAAAISDSDFHQWIVGLLDKPHYMHKERRHENGGEVLKRAAKELRALHKDSVAWLGVRAQRAIKARLDAVVKDSRRLLAKAARTEEIGRFQRYRQTFETVMATGPIASMEKHNAETINRVAIDLADTCNRRGFRATANKLATIAATASRRHADCVKAEKAEAFRREAEGRAAWLAGSTDSALRYKRFSDEMGRALIRARDVTRNAEGEITGGTLETSHGAEVPLTAALQVFRMVKLCRERGKGWKRNGATLPVGYYQVDAIDAEGNFVAGCHKFSWPEIERLAALLSVATLPASDTTNHG